MLLSPVAVNMNQPNLTAALNLASTLTLTRPSTLTPVPTLTLRPEPEPHPLAPSPAPTPTPITPTPTPTSNQGSGVVGMHGSALTEPLNAATPTVQSAASGDV